ncbi:ATP-binding protein [Chitinibacter sp. S2-10]|uniref:ATP-binding protein n=1 Tax=Chitinibacter sp. S2-10 TaxID=3373597 RepID=UPI0039779CC1
MQSDHYWQRLKQRFGQSLLSRLTVLIILATLLSWSVFSAVLLHEARKETTELLDKQLSAYTDMLWQNLGDEDDLSAAQTPHQADHLRLAFALYNHQQLLQAGNLSGIPYQNTKQSDPYTIRVGEQDWRICVRQDSERQLIIAEPLKNHQKIVAEILEHLGETAAFALLLLIPLLLFAIWRGLQPLQTIGRELSQRAPDNLSALQLEVPSEIAPLRDRLNELFAQVTATLARERRFTADAAHELRTPLAGLRLQIELAQSSPREETRHKALGKALEGVDRTSRLVAQLLEMSRLEHGQLPELSPLDLAELARQALQDAGIDATQHLRLEQAVQIRGHALLLNLLLRNLLDNARRYAGEQAQIDIVIGDHQLRVLDNGPGVSEETLARLGERFYRPSGQSQPGAGLGLSIVRRIAQLHNATISFGNRIEGGFAVKIDFSQTNQN